MGNRSSARGSTLMRTTAVGFPYKWEIGDGVSMTEDLPERTD